MPRIKLKTTSLIVAGAVMLLAGCQFTGLPSARRDSSENSDRPLESRQVAEVQLSLARSLELRGEVEPALTAYQRAVEQDPSRATGYWRMAILQDRQGRIEESAALYQQALQLDPKNPDLLCDYGYSLYLQRRWAEAEERLRMAITLKPKHLRAHNNLGLVLAQIDKGNEALAEFRKAGCTLADAHCNLAFVLTLNRRWSEARTQYELALDANPEFTVATSGLKNLETVAAKAVAGADNIDMANYETPGMESPTEPAEEPVVTNAAVSDLVDEAPLSSMKRIE